MGLSSAQLINYLLFVVLLIMFSRTLKQAKSVGNGKGFMNAYSKILANDLDAEENLDKYIESEKKGYLLSQAYLLKAYMNIDGDKDPKEYLDKVDVKAIFADEKGRFDRKRVLNNITFFLWSTLFIARCVKENKLELADYLNDNIKNYDDFLNNFLEYKLYKGIYEGVKGDKEHDFVILKQLVEGEYPSLVYEKRYIGLYKREAALFLTYFNEQIDEFWKEDIPAFVGTVIGRRLSQDLGLYETYRIEEAKEAIPSDGEEEENK